MEGRERRGREKEAQLCIHMFVAAYMYCTVSLFLWRKCFTFLEQFTKLLHKFDQDTLSVLNDNVIVSTC